MRLHRAHRCAGAWVVALAAALAVVAPPRAAAVASKKASFGVRAKVLSGWPKTPSAAQSLEWLREIGTAEAAAYLRQLASSSNGSQAMEFAEARIKGDSVRTFHELLVQNSYYSPLIEMLRSLERWHRRQFGGACSAGAAWALVWKDRAATPVAACEAASLSKLLLGASEGSGASGEDGGAFVSSQMDHVLQPGSAEGPVAIVYGALVPDALQGLGSLLKEVDGAATAWRVIFRHADGLAGPEGPGRDLLTGWGLEMAIKSSEYKTHAEEGDKDKGSEEVKQLEGGDGSGESDGSEGVEKASDSGDIQVQQEPMQELDGPLELDGLLFHTLLKRAPALRSHLFSFKEQLEVERDTDAVLKAWEIKDIGLQATARIKSSSTPLLALMRVSQNFPAHVVGLSRITVPDKLRSSIQRLRSTVRESAEVFSLNGRLVRPDHSDLSLFPMLKSLLPYFVGIERLVRTGLPEAAACELLKDSSRNLPPERLDWRSPYLPPATYHVLKDKKTQRWGDSLQHLLYAQPGGLAPVRLPLFNMVFTFDPAEIADLMVGYGFLATAPMPMALHFVMVPSRKAAGGAKWDEQVLGKTPSWLQNSLAVGGDGRGDGERISRIISAAYTSILEKSPKKARAFFKDLAQAAKTMAEDGKEKRWPDTDKGIEQLHSLWAASYPLETKGGEEATGKSKQFTATVAKKGGRLGMAIKFEQRMAIVSEVLDGQAGDAWNKQEGQQNQIRKDDCILKANNVELHSEQDFKDNVGTDPVILLIDIGCHAAMKTAKKGDPEEEEEAKTKVKNHKETGGDESKTWAEIVSGSGAFADLVKNATTYVNGLGLPVPSMTVNGKLLLKGAYEGQNIYQTIGMEQQNFQRALYMGELHGEAADAIEEFIASQGLLSAYHQDITPEVGQRGGEEGMGGGGAQAATDAQYLQWPSQPFLALPFLQSIEPEPVDLPPTEAPAEAEEGLPASVGAGLPDGSLSFFHVTVLSRLSHAYLLHAFASHMLAPDRALLAANKKIAVPPLLSHWSVLIDSNSAGGEAGALAELAACVQGIFGLKVSDDSVNRQKLGMLKFLGAAIPAAVGADGLLPAHVRELCELGMGKKIDPDHHEKAKASIESARASPSQDKQLLHMAAAARGGKGDSTALWVCNGRRITLEADGQAVSPRHVQALELIEAQYDISQTVGEADPEAGGMGGMMGMMGMMGGMGGGPPQKGPPPPRVKPLYERLANVSHPGGKALAVQAHGLIASIRSEAFAGAFGRSERFDQPQEIFEKAPAAFKLRIPPARPDAASPITVYGIVDPLSTTAQSASAVLALFGMTFNAEVNLVLNPHTRLSEYPLKRYYREVIRWPDRLADGRKVSELDDGGGDVGSGAAELTLATKHTLTAAVHALPTWLVTAHEAENDMDNLRLVDVGNGKLCETTYLLNQLYVEGQAFVIGEDGWPIASAKGVEIDIVDAGGKEVLDDTIVMGNLGYFQVSGNPGVYGVRLKPGLSNETFVPANVQAVEVASYITPPYQLRVRTRPGRDPGDLEKEQSKRLDAPADSSVSSGSAAGKKKEGGLSSWFGGITSMFGGSEIPAAGDSQALATATPSVGDPDESLPTIHIFTVASGHLYEKLLGIMILSVRNHTRCPLHFWFISNFLSPKFKAFIPHFARRYKFNFDFVTYKWPSWLNPQSEKQRLIWAYKILFLDVLFPLDVPKIMYIDADQVVRADVRELWDTDLKGKVYGFVPMGDTNMATEGFRFWKQGYWQNHLGDLKYHISALYVVDLVEFRRTSTGDQLRGIYNQLSRDPNSLSNLDQDLPNFAQHQVPIHSLPAEWLWCETWCSQEVKPVAKTIDLCQNPLTKEPKIVMAQRIISEWKMYHDEVQRFQATLDSQGNATIAVLPQSAAAVAAPASGKADKDVKSEL